MRSAAWLFVTGGLLALLSVGLPGARPRSSDVVDVVGVAAVVLGGVVWLLPWDRWSRWASLVLVPPAFTMVALAEGYGTRQPFTYASYLVIVFAWVGLAHPPRTSTWLAPVAIPFYLLPAILQGWHLSTAVPSMVLTIVVGVVIGETVAWVMHEAVTARAEAERQAALLRRAVSRERKANRRLAEASVRDELTGVGNRRHAVALLAAVEEGDAVVMIDLDHFKAVNDTDGHDAGDRVLQELARHLQSSVRDADAVARYGGEEFMLVLREVGGGALFAVERLVKSWRATGPRTTFSAGVAVHRAGRTPEETLSRADAALYDAKRAGRDRVSGNLVEVA